MENNGFRLIRIEEVRKGGVFRKAAEEEIARKNYFTKCMVNGGAIYRMKNCNDTISCIDHYTTYNIVDEANVKDDLSCALVVNKGKIYSRFITDWIDVVRVGV